MGGVPVVTVDGPSGVGKGTLCQRLAANLGWHLLDSGALYRVLALKAEKEGQGFEDQQQLVHLAQHLDVSFPLTSDGTERILLDGVDVATDIRTEQAGGNASKVAVLADVRAALLQRQRDFAVSPGLIADGRDMGSMVFKNAPVKLFLTASAEIRAKRRCKQLNEKGLSANIAALEREIAERDRRDATRTASPLVAADDAIVIDTSEIGIEEVLERALSICMERL